MPKLKATNKKINTSQTKSTTDKFLESLDAEEKKQFFEEYRELVLSEIVLATKAKDFDHVKKLENNLKRIPQLII